MRERVSTGFLRLMQWKMGGTDSHNFTQELQQQRARNPFFNGFFNNAVTMGESESIMNVKYDGNNSGRENY